MENSKRIKSAMVLRKCTAPISSRTVASQPCGRTALSDPFKRYKPESERSIRAPKVKTNESKLLRDIRQWFLDSDFSHVLDSFSAGRKTDGFGYYYKNALAFAKSIRYSPADVAKFLIMITDDQLRQGEFEKTAALGLLLSALINNHQERSFTVYTNHLEHVPDKFGYRNVKDVTVHGDLDYEVADEMSEGTITVKGNVGISVGIGMSGGILVIHGNMGDEGCGRCMTGGKIIINGNAGANIGDGMTGGEIHLNGNYVSLSDDIEGGNIFHKGKQIVKNGKRLI